MITLYHGSHKLFNSFKIGKEWVVRDESLLAEGLGIYLTEDKKLADSYGKYLYTVEIDEQSVTDFTDAFVVRKVIHSISTDVTISLDEEIDIEQVIERVLNGGIKVTQLYDEINQLLDSNYSFYERYGHLITYEEDCLLEKVKVSFFHHIKDVIKYHDRSFLEPVFICFRHPEKLIIKECTKQEDVSF